MPATRPTYPQRQRSGARMLGLAAVAVLAAGLSGAARANFLVRAFSSVENDTWGQMSTSVYYGPPADSEASTYSSIKQGNVWTGADAFVSGAKPKLTAFTQPGFSSPSGSGIEQAVGGGAPRTAISWAGADGQLGLLRSYSGSYSTPYDPENNVFTGNTMARISDRLSLSGNSLALNVHLDGSWLASFAIGGGVITLPGVGQGTANLDMILSLWALPSNPVGGSPSLVGRMGFSGQSTTNDGGYTITSTYGWLGEAQNMGDSIDDSRSLLLTGLNPGDYDLDFIVTSSNSCEDRCAAEVAFGSTAMLGITGDYTSASGYSYPGFVAPAVPEPTSTSLAAVGLAALFAASRRRRQ